MFMKHEDVVNHNTRFWNAMVDLKVDGWKAFADAMDSYTMGFYKNNLREMTGQVEQVADAMKVDLK